MQEKENLYKIVFEDAGRSKVVFGYIDLSDDQFLKVDTTIGNTFYIQKSKITFLREVKDEGTA